MAMNFPANPTVGVTSNGFVYGSKGTWESNKVIGTPAGVIMPYAGVVIPAGYLAADGSTKNRADYPELFSALGGISSPYGLPSGTTFTLPDLRTKIPVGKNTSGTFSTLGSTGGSETVTLSEANLPSHTHSINHDHAAFTTGSGGTHTHTFGADDMIQNYGYTYAGAFAYDATSSPSGNGRHLYVNGDGAHTHSIDVPAFTGTSGATGSGTSFSNLQPYITLNYIIKY